MASEYISYLILFSLGMVIMVSVNSSISTLQTSISNNAAEAELDSILTKIEGEIESGLQNKYVDLSDESSYDLSLNIELPRYLANRYRYEIEFITSPDNYTVLTGSIPSISDDYLINHTLNYKNSSSNLISFSGSLNSLFGNHKLTITKTSGSSLIQVVLRTE